MLSSLDTTFALAKLDPLILEPPPEEKRQRLLSFPLGLPNQSLIPLDRFTEILRIDMTRILRVPETPSYILGAYNWRGEMLWLVDLPSLLGCPPLAQQRVTQTPTAMVVQIEGQPLGLVVARVNDIEFCNLSELRPATPGLFSVRVLPFLMGYLPDDSTVLNLDAIAQFLQSKQRLS